MLLFLDQASAAEDLTSNFDKAICTLCQLTAKTIQIYSMYNHVHQHVECLQSNENTINFSSRKVLPPHMLDRLKQQNQLIRFS